MKTDKNSRTQTTSGTNAHPEQAIPDTNPKSKFKVIFYLMADWRCDFILEATTLTDAKKMASKIKLTVPSGFDKFIHSVEPIAEGQSHE